MPKHLTLSGTRLVMAFGISLCEPVAADCQEIFATKAPYVFEGATSPGIKNDFVDAVQLTLTPSDLKEDRVTFAQGTVRTSRLPGGVVDWVSSAEHRWGNQCLTMDSDNGVQAFLALSWDPEYRHPNVHGVIRKEDNQWVFRGFLDNAAQQFHEAAVELRLVNAP